MSAKKIITDENILKKKSIDIDSVFLEQVVNDLIDTAENYRNSEMGCAGLAANQIGYLFRVLVIKLGDWYEPIINPKIIKKGGRMVKAQEGCLSRPNKPTVAKMRSQRITIEYIDMGSEKRTDTFHGFDARVIQHEMDHFEGKLI
jgi:peptide deformylase